MFCEVLDAEGLWPARPNEPATATTATKSRSCWPPQTTDPRLRAGATREFLALCSIAARVGRPGTPTDQAWIKTLFGHVKTQSPHLEKIADIYSETGQRPLPHRPIRLPRQCPSPNTSQNRPEACNPACPTTSAGPFAAPTSTVLL